MKTLKINTLIQDKQTGEQLKPGQIIEREDKRAKDFAKYAEDITAIEVVEDKPVKAKRKSKKKG